MNRTLVLSGLAALLSAGVVLFIVEQSKPICASPIVPLTGDEPIVSTDSLLQQEKLSSRAGMLPDGGAVCFSVVNIDGGVRVVLDRCPCVMRLPGSDPTSCMVNDPMSGPRDFGEGNVFSEDMAFDAGTCERTACSIIFGECQI